MSVVNVDHVLFSRARWRLRFLIPFWVIQVSILLGLMGIFAYRLAETFEHYEDEKNNGEAPMVEVVWEATNVAFSTTSLLLSILEIARQATEVLTPFLMLATHIVKLVLALAILGLDVTVYLQRTDRHYSIVALALDCGLLAATLATFIYSFRTYRSLLKYEDYALSGSGGGEPHSLEWGNSVAVTGGGKHVSVVGSSKVDTAYVSPTAGVRNSAGADAEGGNLKGEIDRAIGAGRGGWNGGGGSQAKDEIVVGVGVVPRSRSRESQVDLPRTKSFVTERGSVGAYDPADEGDDETEGGRGHGRVPSVVVSGVDDDRGDGDEDTRGLLSGRDHGK